VNLFAMALDLTVAHLLLWSCPFVALVLSICCSGLVHLLLWSCPFALVRAQPRARHVRRRVGPGPGDGRCRAEERSNRTRRGADRILRATGQYMKARVTF